MKRWMNCLRKGVVTLGLLCAAQLGTAGPFEFQGGDRVVFLGDSITHNGYWYSYIYNFYVTRFPDRDIKIINAGISGGKAPDALDRLSWDVLPNQPTDVVIMLGMNDVGTSPFTKYSAEDLARYNDAKFDEYSSKIRAIVEALQEANADIQITLCSSSPYDEKGTQERESAVGKNEAIRRQIPFLKELAEEKGLLFVDFNTAMLKLDEAGKAKDPNYTIVSHDRVHPGQVGHMVMTYELLKGQGAEGTVSDVTLDFASGKVEGAKRAEVSGVEVAADAGRISWKQTAEALPCPVDKDAKEALDLVPFTEELNRQYIRVKNLPAGKYKLAISANEVGVYTSDQLASGVNLSTNDNAPQYKQAHEVFDHGYLRWKEERNLRTTPWIRVKILDVLGVDANDPVAVDKALEDWKNHESYSDSHGRYIGMFKEFRGKEGELQTKVDSYTKRMRDAAQPTEHEYVLTRVD